MYLHNCDYHHLISFQDLVVRISFILGNLTAKSDVARTRLFSQPKALDILVNVLKYYVEIDLKVGNLKTVC